MNWRDLVRLVFSPWVIGGAILVAVILLAGVIGLLFWLRPAPSIQADPTAIVNVIPAPTATPLPTATPEPTAPPTATSPVPPSPPPGVIAVGDYVQISGTGGDGLRLRVDPDLDSQVRLLGEESEIFRVQDGPSQKGDYTWWYLVGPYDEARRGWAVSNYLEVVQGP